MLEGYKDGLPAHLFDLLTHSPSFQPRPKMSAQELPPRVSTPTLAASSGDESDIPPLLPLSSDSEILSGSSEDVAAQRPSPSPCEQFNATAGAAFSCTACQEPSAAPSQSTPFISIDGCFRLVNRVSVCYDIICQYPKMHAIGHFSPINGVSFILSSDFISLTHVSL